MKCVQIRYPVHMADDDIIRDPEERQKMVERFKAEGKSDAWIAGWMRYQMRHQSDPIDPAQTSPGETAS